METTGKRTKSQQELLDTALSYAKRGWAVFPLHTPVRDEDGLTACSCRTPDCKSLGKHPRTRTGFKSATTDAKQIQQWWDMWPDANIGIATGSVSGNLVVIDVDTKDNGIENWKAVVEAQDSAIGETPVALTGGGGCHYLLHCDEKVQCSASKITRGVDVRGADGYIVAPPSEHASGRQYQWELSSHPNDVPIAEMPGWLFELCAGTQAPLPIKKSSASPSAVAGVGVVSEGSRNESLFRIGRSLWATDCDDLETLTTMLKSYNQSKCVPPLDEKEVETIAKSVTKKEPGTSKRKKQKESIDLVDRVTREATPDEEIKKPDGPLTFARGDHTELAAKLLVDARGDSPVPIIYDRGEFWRYEQHIGLWQSIRESILHRHVQRYAGAVVGDKSLKVNDTKGILKAASYQCDSPGFFDNAPAGLVFRNGFVSIGPDNTPHLAEHSPEHRGRHSMNSDWNTSMKAPLFKQFLTDIFTPEHAYLADDPDQTFAKDRDKSITLTAEFIGTCLIGEATKYAASLVLYGQNAANGKSTLIKIVKALFPATSVTSISPTVWDNRFYLADLAISRLNAVSEMPASQITANDLFKAVISGDDVTVAKKFKDPFTMRPRAGHIFACNELPATIDQTEGFWRRFIVLDFPRTFAAWEQDRTLAERIIANELGAIAVNAILAAADMRKRGEYTLPPNSIITKAKWKGESDPVRLWMADRTKRCDGDCPAKCLERYSSNCSMLPEQAYASFREWCRDSGNAFMTKQSFLVALKRTVGQRNDGTRRFYPIYLYSR